jgi:GMP synthase-like glutamine amidotransferase
MKPIAIFRFSASDGPGYCASFLDRHAVPWQLFKLDEGEAIPASLDEFSGFILMGGAMSVNDDLPWIPPMLSLVRHAIAAQQPCLGHCLGGQLIAKALGGVVSANPVKEIGWQPVRVEDSPVARMWLGDDLNTWTTFQWHGETFTIPHGATRILTGDACANQAYVIGNSLGMQCHVEMTSPMIKAWAEDWAKEKADPTLPSVQRPQEMLIAMDENLVTLHQAADRLYGQWLKGLKGMAQ